MTKTVNDLPVLEITDDDFWTGRLPHKIAAFAGENGPVFRRTADEGIVPGGNLVFMVGPEANRFVFHTGREHFSHEKGWNPILGEVLGKGLLNMDPPEHTHHRRMWSPAFTNSVMETYIPVMHQVIQNRTNPWPEREQVDVYAEARDITFDAAAAALAGVEPGETVDELRDLFYMLLHGGREITSEEEWVELMTRVQGRLLPMLLQLIAEKRAQPVAAVQNDVLGRIVHARDENGQPLNDMQILGHLNILLVAGHETTTTLGSWTLFQLAQRPEWVQRLRVEVDEALAGEAAIGNTRALFSREALNKMPDLDNFIKESGRLYPPVFTVPRYVSSEFDFGGFYIPPGTWVRLSLAAGHLLPEVFAEPERFDPDRFGPERREDRATPYSLVTFGGGPRICIGINFANIEVRILAAHILRHYDMQVVPGQPARHVGYFTSMAPDGLHLIFHPRE